MKGLYFSIVLEKKKLIASMFTTFSVSRWLKSVKHLHQEQVSIGLDFISSNSNNRRSVLGRPNSYI